MRRNGHKYNAVRTTIDGHTFASKAEAKRYGELRLLEKAGEIERLELQPKFPIYAVSLLSDPDEPPELPFKEVRLTKVGRYTADFKYFDKRKRQEVIEDIKSSATSTQAYRLRKRHVEAQYGVTITEITS